MKKKRDIREILDISIDDNGILNSPEGSFAIYNILPINIIDIKKSKIELIVKTYKQILKLLNKDIHYIQLNRKYKYYIDEKLIIKDNSIMTTYINEYLKNIDSLSNSQNMCMYYLCVKTTNDVKSIENINIILERFEKVDCRVKRVIEKEKIEALLLEILRI
ncbi:MAG: hypothetical protein RR922_00190 [Clostridia bacterium]